ncbi:MAG: insulinase family protein [Clostridia bacterium]|nr:insulinase family protein [Clostridia bacterium]
MNLITLENGLRIFTHKRDDLRSATVGVWVMSGSRNESADISGISHFIEHIVFKGSLKRSGFEIAEGMDEIGAHVNAYTTKEYTFFYTKALDYQILKASDILFDMIRHPRLDEKDIETEKGVVLEEINMCEDDPGDVVYEVNETSLFKGTSLSMKILGERETVSAFKKEDIEKYMNDNYCADKTVIGISGNFDEEEMLRKVREYFSDMPEKSKGDFFYKVPFNRDIALKTIQTEQTHIMMCFDGVGIEHEDLYPLQVCMFILGTGTSSMLYQRIREELGLCYSVDSWLGRYRGGGYIAIAMSLSPVSEERAINEVTDIVGSFSRNVTERQVAIAKEKLISSLIMSREQPQSKLSSMGYNLLMVDHFVEDDYIIDSIKAITLDDVIAVSEKYLRLDKMSFTAVGKVKAREEYEHILESAIKK